MLHGLRKMVSSKSEDCTKQISIATPDLLLTPNLTQSAKKRKNLQQSGFSTKRRYINIIFFIKKKLIFFVLYRRQIMDTLPQASALASTPFKLCQTPVCHHPKPEDTPGTTQPELKIIPLDLDPKTTPVNTNHLEHKPNPLDEKNYSEFVRIPKSEYEEIKSRVSAIEDRISHELNCVQAAQTSSHVQTVYEKTLEEVEAMSPTTDQLAKRLSRELKIRRSSEHKIIRSPSARKIGTIRRRSQENAKIAKISRNQSCSLPRVTLKRGRPNTILSGLPQPSPVKDVARSSSFHNHTPSVHHTCENSAENLEKWASAEMYFKKVESIQKLSEQNRDSLARLRSQNAGMVLAKAKLFNELSSDGSAEYSAGQPVKRSTLRRGGTFPRQNPTLRRQRNVEHGDGQGVEKENDPQRLMNGGVRRSPRRSPRRAKPVKLVRQ